MQTKEQKQSFHKLVETKVSAIVCRDTQARTLETRELIAKKKALNFWGLK